MEDQRREQRSRLLKKKRMGGKPALVQKAGALWLWAVGRILGPGRRAGALGVQRCWASQGAGSLGLSRPGPLLGVPPTARDTDVRAGPSEGFLGRGLPWSVCASKLPGLRAQGWRQSAGLPRPSHCPSGPCHGPQGCAPSVCGPGQPRESAHLPPACTSQSPPAQSA